MTVASSPDYRRLALASSNLLIQWDARRDWGEPIEAALAMLQAGRQRYDMGVLGHADRDDATAATDWLCAANCFVQASALDDAEEALSRVQELEAAGRIPAERRDIFQALREREQELPDARRRLADLDAWKQRSWASEPPSVERKLQLLLDKVRDYPGLTRLHEWIRDYAWIMWQLDELEKYRILAERHAEWACAFESLGIRYLEYLAWKQSMDCFEDQRIADAIRVVDDYLRLHPRSLLNQLQAAVLLAYPFDPARGDYPRAIQKLQAIQKAPPMDERTQAVACCFEAAFTAQLGGSVSIANLRSRLESIERQTQDAWIAQITRQYRHLLEDAPVAPVNGAVGTTEGGTPAQAGAMLPLIREALQGLAPPPKQLAA
jgi:tetratricopeptide (TPR) repeat protein